MRRAQIRPVGGIRRRPIESERLFRQVFRRKALPATRSIAGGVSRGRWLIVGIVLALVSSGVRATAEGPGLDAARAYGYLQKICRIGPRPSGSRGMAEQQSLIAEHFSRLGAQVSYQPFDAAAPLSGQPVRMSNLVVTWNPKATERVFIACHYDTRP